jgi:hypothetical protein
VAGPTKYSIELELIDKKAKKQLQEFNKWEQKNLKDKKAAEAFSKKSFKERHTEFNKLKKAETTARKEELEHFKKISTLTKQESRFAEQRARQIRQQMRAANREYSGVFRNQHGSARPTMGGVGGAARFAGGVAGMGVAALGGLFMGATMSGYRKWAETERGIGSNLSGMSTPAHIRASLMRKNQGGRLLGSNLGFSPGDSAGHSKIMGRSAGAMSPHELQLAMRTTGMEASETGGIFGALRRSGQDFSAIGPGGRTQGGKTMEKMIEKGLLSGLERGRLPEYFEGVSNLLEESQSKSSRDGDVGGISDMLSRLGASGLSGFQGQRGAAFLNQIQQGILNPKGDAQHAFLLQSQKFGVPGGKTGYFEAELAREKGLGGGNLDKIFETFKKMFGGPDGKDHQNMAQAMRGTFGTGLQQNLDFFAGMESGDPRTKAAAKAAMEDAGKSWEDKALKLFEDIGSELKHQTSMEEGQQDQGRIFAEQIKALEKMVHTLVVEMTKVVLAIAELVTSISDYFNKESAKSREAAQEAMQLTQLAGSTTLGPGVSTYKSALGKMNAYNAGDAGYTGDDDAYNTNRADLLKNVAKSQALASADLAAQKILGAGYKGQVGPKFRAFRQSQARSATAGMSTDKWGKFLRWNSEGRADPRVYGLTQQDIAEMDPKYKSYVSDPSASQLPADVAQELQATKAAQAGRNAAAAASAAQAVQSAASSSTGANVGNWIKNEILVLIPGATSTPVSVNKNNVKR